MEKAAGQPLRDIGFNRARLSSVGGIPVRVLRTGISGELGYELHGPAPISQVRVVVIEGGMVPLRQ
jgi:vanillate/3-O-methylgallate O-demethylase